MIADIPTETIKELIEIMKDLPLLYEDKIADEALPKSDFLTPEEVAALLAPVKPNRKAAKPET